jgi:hypothetical protein
MPTREVAPLPGEFAVKEKLARGWRVFDSATGLFIKMPWLARAALSAVQRA